MSTLSLSVSRGRGYRNKSVDLYTGCLGPTVSTERINALIKAIDQVTSTGALLEQRTHARQSLAVLPSRHNSAATGNPEVYLGRLTIGRTAFAMGRELHFL